MVATNFSKLEIAGEVVFAFVELWGVVGESGKATVYLVERARVLRGINQEPLALFDLYYIFGFSSFRVFLAVAVYCLVVFAKKPVVVEDNFIIGKRTGGNNYSAHSWHLHVANPFKYSG